MPVPVVQNTQTSSGSTVASVTINKPTSLAVGDLMVAFISFYQSGGSRTLTTPAGWAADQKADGSTAGMAIYTKIADSGDVAASNFAFAVNSTADRMAGSLSRVTGYSSIGSSEKDETASPGSQTVFTFTTNLTPTVAANLIMAGYFGADATFGGAPTISTYTSNPSETWSEIADVGVGGGGGIGLAFSVATANNTDTSNITSRGCTFSDNIDIRCGSLVIILEGTTNASGTNALLSADADFFAPTASSGTSGTAALHSADADLFSASGAAINATNWHNEAKNTTTWTNEDKS